MNPEDSNANLGLFPGALHRSATFPTGLALALVLALALGMRLLSINEPWSGLAHDFHSHCGSSAVGEFATRFASDGLGPTKGMPTYWYVELDDGTVAVNYYSHHPALFNYLEALSLKVFGVHEWALRLVPLVLSMFAVFSMWRLFVLLWSNRVAFVATSMMAVVPFAAWYGMLTWTESAITWTGLEATRCYLLWLRDGRQAHLNRSAAWMLLAGLFDWSGGFILAGIGLHGLLHRKYGWSGLSRLLLLPAGFSLAALIHWLHMGYALPPGFATAEAGKTLGTVTSLTTSLPHFLQLQFQFAWTFLGPVVFVLFLLGIGRYALLAMGRRLTAEDSFALVLLLPGILYIGLFPQRSVNHDFFLMISLPGILALCTSAGMAALAKLSPRNSRQLGIAGLAIALGLTTFSTVQVWRIRRSDQIEHLIATPKLSAILDNDQALILAPIGRGMCLPFYSKAEVIQSTDSREIFEKHYKHIVLGTSEHRPAYLFFDIAHSEQLSSDVVADLLGEPISDDPKVHAARVQVLFDSLPDAQLAAMIESTLYEIHVPLYQDLKQRFESEVIVVANFGAYELFDLRRRK